jgi:hypothetical protein
MTGKNDTAVTATRPGERIIRREKWKVEDGTLPK